MRAWWIEMGELKTKRNGTHFYGSIFCAVSLCSRIHGTDSRVAKLMVLKNLASPLQKLTSSRRDDQRQDMPLHRFCDGKACGEIQCDESRPCPAAKDWDWVGGAGVISLEEDRDRLHVFHRAMRPTGLGAQVKDFVMKRHPKGAMVGCFTSHQHVVRDIMQRGARWGVVFEDDARPYAAGADQALTAELKRFVESIRDTDNPVVISLGYATVPVPFATGSGKAVKGFDSIVRANNTFLAHAYAVNEPAMRVIADLEPVMHFDKALMGTKMMPDNTEYYVTKPQMFYQCDCSSATGTADVIQATFGMRGLQNCSDFFVTRPWSLVGVYVGITLLLVLLFLAALLGFRGISTTSRAVGWSSAVVFLAVLIVVICTVAMTIEFFT
jgi:hypothetical protein